MKRIGSIDFVRGTVMIIMALDHVRDMMHRDSIIHSPTDLSHTTALLFFTRWITYLCAPIFVFLAGSSAYLSGRRNQNPSAFRRFLIKRGFFLIVIEFTVVNFGLYFDPGFHILLFEVIAAIGTGFIVLGLIQKFPIKTIAGTGLAIILLHDLVPFVPLPESPVLKTVLMPLFGPGAFPLSAHTSFIMGYPPIPWLGIILLGFATGKWFERDQRDRKNVFLRTGMIAILLFVVVRFLNIYGDPVPWTPQKTGLFSFLSFMNVTKYPPSLSFCLVTLGIMFLMLSLAELIYGRVNRFVSRYGQVPLFYFLVHFYLIHIILILLLFVQGFNWWQMDFASGSFGRPKGADSGLALWAIYLIWIAVVLLLYKPCVWYGNYKAREKSRKWWLRYL